MPWNVLFYRFSSTFIDDMFAFIIKMPTMHRISVFRDDIVFLLYLGQRWYYPVDASRTATVSGDGELAADQAKQPKEASSDVGGDEVQCVSTAGHAYVTLLTSDSFLPGVQALAHTLHKHSRIPLVIMATAQVKKHTRVQLRRLLLCSLLEVEAIPNPHADSVHVDGWVNSGTFQREIAEHFSPAVHISRAVCRLHKAPCLELDSVLPGGVHRRRCSCAELRGRLVSAAEHVSCARRVPPRQIQRRCVGGAPKCGGVSAPAGLGSGHTVT